MVAEHVEMIAPASRARSCIDSPLRIALDQERQDRSVIPVRRAKSKDERKPLVKWTEFQQRRATPAEIRHMWNQWPDANPIIVVGAISGIIGLDIDSQVGLDWVREQGLPDTFIVTRGAPGRCHVWFTHPGFKVSNWTIHPGVEVKGDRSTLPAPGALHWSGAPYVGNDQPVVKAPDWLLDLLRPKERPPVKPARIPAGDDQRRNYALAALNDEAAILSRTDTNRNDQLFRSVAATASFIPHGLLTETEIQGTFEPIALSIGLTPDETRSTVRSGIAHGLVNPRDLSHLENRTAPAPDVQTEPTGTLTWQGTLHDSLERWILACLPKSGKTVAKVLRAIVENMGGEWFTQRELSKRSGIPINPINRAFELYGLADLLLERQSASTDIFLRMECNDPDHGHSEKNTTNTCSAGRPSITYRLRPYSEAKVHYLDRIVWPRLVEKYLKAVDGLLARATAELLQALDRQFDQPGVDILAAYSPALDEKLSEAQKQAIQAAYDRATLEYKRIARELQDMTCTPLPDTPDGKTWQQDYVGTVVVRNMQAVREPTQSWYKARQATGLSPATLRRAECRLAITRPENWSHHLEITTPEALPEPGRYDRRIGGAPAEITFEDGSVLDYRGLHVYQRAEREVRAGGRVWIKYRCPNKAPRPMTPEEREAARTAEIERKSRKRAGKADGQKPRGTPESRGPIDSPFYGIGHRPGYALGWAKAVDELLGPVRVNGRYMLLSRPVTIFERYKLPVGEPISIERVYAAVYDAHYFGADGGALWDALGDEIQTLLRRYHYDEIDPCDVVIRPADLVVTEDPVTPDDEMEAEYN